MGYEIVAGLLCVMWAAFYTARRPRPAAVSPTRCRAARRR
jgi:hypothetical protein